MGAWVALLRAVNVGGTGKLPMSALRATCEAAGFARVQTYIQSGNALFTSALPEARVKAKLEAALGTAVLVRSASELGAIAARSPFRDAPPNRVVVFFLDQPPPREAIAGLGIPGREEVRALGREVFVHYPDGQGGSKLRLPFADRATGRNLNTVSKLAEMARALVADGG